MIQGNINSSPIRSVKGKVELYIGSTLLDTFSYNDRLSNFEISREGENGKFFGFGVCQKLTLKLTDKNRELDILKGIHSFKVYLTTDNEYNTPFPSFHVDDVKRDENTNELTITAYDVLYEANNNTIDSVLEAETINIELYANHVVNKLGLSNTVKFIGIPEDDPVFALTYPEGANIEGTETVRDLANDIAEITQSIYYIDNTDTLVFKRLDKDGNALLTIGKDIYFTLKTNPAQTLTAICRATELGDNVSTVMEIDGVRQYIRDNVFMSRDEDIQTLLNNAMAAIGGISIAQFECSWRGNFLLEVGDKIAIITRDNETIVSYLINDTLTYNGGLKQVSQWNYEEDTGANHYNSNTIGESIKQTFARVDKANKKIDIVASEVSDNKDAIAAINITTDSITNSVRGLEDRNSELVDEYEALYNEVQTKMSKDDYTIVIQDVIRDSGVESVITKTGFTFDETGLTVDKYNSEMKTTITEDGMKVFKNEEEVLTANNTGVVATNLHADTYLIIGKNSRIEDFGSDRTAIFWIG